MNREAHRASLPGHVVADDALALGACPQVRHPMYGGLILIAAGLTLSTGNETRLVMTLLTALILDKKVGGTGGRRRRSECGANYRQQHCSRFN